MQIKNRALIIIVLTTSVFFAGCSRENGTSPAAPGQMPPPSVGIVTTEIHPVELKTELPGRTTPYQIAEIRPQVSGIIQQRLFKEGGDVKSGMMLYQIDPAVYQAAYDSAVATLARAEANLGTVRLRAERYQELVKIDAVSQQDYNDAVAALKQAEADVAAGLAAVEKARIDLSYTQLKSPIQGRISRSTVTAGALVTANQPSMLATVQQLDPIYVDLNQSSAEMLRLRRDFESGKLQKTDRKDAVSVTLILEDGTKYRHEGKLAFSEVTVDQLTGSVTLRAEFPNPEHELLPGMYVRAVIDQGVDNNAITLPHKAVMHDPRGNAQVMILNSENKVEARTVEAGRAIGDVWLITGGLKAGERVITDGLQMVRPGAPATVAGAEEKATPAAAQ